MVNAMRSMLALIAGLGLVVASSGWLYLIQPHVTLPGPRIADALPLDELSGRAAVPLAAFVAVWSTVALLLGLLARFARAERLTAGLLLALAVGGWCYLYTGTALLVVRQIPAEQAFGAATGKEAIYLPAVLAGAAGALLGRRRSSATPRSPLVLSWCVAAAGFLGILDAVLPEHRHALITVLAPERVQGLSSALVAPVSFVLLALARALARRKRAAWQLALALLLGLVALHLEHRFGYGALFTTLVAVGLIARRGDFDARGDPERRAAILLHAAASGAAILAYGCAALWLNRLMADQAYTFRFALDETAGGLMGLNATGSEHLTGTFADWFPRSVFLLGLTACAILLYEGLAPWRYRLRQEARERERAHQLVAAWGSDTLAPFALRRDKSYFFGENEDAFLAYRVVAGVAIVSGDPIGCPSAHEALVGDFIRFAHQRGWRTAILGASEECLPLYRAHGLRALYHGDEAVVETSTFSLEGRAIRKVRQSVHRLTRAGYRAQVLYAGDVAPELRRQLEQIACEWRRGEPERGFVMALDGLFALDDEPAVFVVGLDPTGAAAGCLHFAVAAPGSALSLSSMPRLRTTPNGFNEWLVCEAIAWARSRGFERLSLNFSPFAALLAPEADLSTLQQVERLALRQMKGHFQLDNLLLFNRKFFPRWQRRFVVYERRLDLPRVGLAALAAEAYLTFGRATRP